MTETIAQSPSIEDLLSARSKRSNHNLATNSFYSTITTLSARTDLDISDAARLAMARESANPVWSPAMSSHYGDETEVEDEDGSSTQGGHVNSNAHALNNSSHISGHNNDNTTDFPTPTMSESEYSRSPSLASVRMAAVVQKVTPTTSGLGISTSSTTYASAPSSSEGHNSSQNEVTPTVSPAKRVLNARNLIINTSGSVGAAHAYPHESTTPSVAPPSSARIEHSPPPRRPPPAGRSQSTLETSTTSSSSNKLPYSPMRTATMPSVPRSAGPTASTSSSSSSYSRNSPTRVTRVLSKSKLVRRSSTDSSLSYLSSPLADEDDLDEDASLGPHKASLLRMQSFLGPKMKHISPAPWSIDGSSPNPEDRTSVFSTTSSVPASESAATGTSGRGSIWSEIDSEIGSVHMATKSIGRINNNSNNNYASGTAATASKSVLKDALGSSATGTLKGLGLAIANASAAVASVATGSGSGSGSAAPSRPSMSSERSAKSRTTTASSAFSTWSGTSRGTTNDGSNGKFNGLSRSHSHEPFNATNIPLPPMPASAGFPPSSYTHQSQQPPATMKVTNIVRCKSPEGSHNVPASAPPTTTTTPGVNRSASPAGNGPPSFFNHHQHRAAGKNSNGPGAEVPFSQLTTVTSAPECANDVTTMSSASACIALLSSSAPDSSASHGSDNGQNNSKHTRKQPSLPRKRPPLFHQDSTHSATTSTCTGESYTTSMTHSTSQTSLPANLSDPSDLSAKAGTSPNGMKLISLEDARERERERGNIAAERRAEQIYQLQQHQHQQALSAQRALAALPSLPTAPTSAPPPPPVQAAPPAKALKNKKSGFLRMFKNRDTSSAADQPQVPPLPRPSTDSLPSPKMLHGFPNTRKASVPTNGDSAGRDKILHIGPQSPNLENQNAGLPKTPLRSDFASAVPFPHQQQQCGPIFKPQAGAEKPRSASQPNSTNSEASPNPGISAPPHVSLIKPSPDLAAAQGTFANDNRRNPALTVQQKHFLAAAPASSQSQNQSQDGLAPSLSLRPVSMMLSSMPPNFLADLEKSVNNKNAHLQAAAGSTASSSSSGFDAIAGRASPARTPDTPSFVFFDSDNNATPPSGHTPNTPATEEFSNGSSPSGQEQKPTPAFGLPTPPHSASSARTFSASSMPPLPTSPSVTSESAREANITAPLKARVSELEMLVISLRAELAAAKGESIQVVLSDLTNTDLKKACNTCGCLCKTNASVLSRPRMVGHGNMFSSGRN